MKASPGLNYVTGPMGAGKSYFGVRQIVRAIMRGKYAITNVRLKDNWAYRAARHNPSVMPSWLLWKISRTKYGKKYKRTVAFYESLYIYEVSLERAMKYRIPGTKEGRAIFIWDEAHNDLNNRDWNSTKAAEGTKTQKIVNQNSGRVVETMVTEKEVRSLILKWATQLRKLGFSGFLISQHGDNTDAALRRVCNMEIRLRNQREQVRFLGMRVCPIPFFLAMYLPANTPRVGKGSPYISIERYFLGWEKKCYNSMELFHNIQAHIEGEDAIWLPTPGQFTPQHRVEIARADYLANRITITEFEEVASTHLGIPLGGNLLDSVVPNPARPSTVAPAETESATPTETPPGAGSPQAPGGVHRKPNRVRLMRPVNPTEGSA